MWKNACNKKFRAHKIRTGFTASVMNVIISSGARELLSSYTKLAPLRGTRGSMEANQFIENKSLEEEIQHMKKVNSKRK